MTKRCFEGLRTELTNKRLLRKRQDFNVDEQLALFLYAIGHDDGIRLVQDRFRIAREVFDACFLRVMRAVHGLKMDCIKCRDRLVDDKFVLKYDRRFYPYFKVI